MIIVSRGKVTLAVARSRTVSVGGAGMAIGLRTKL
jgi:hypothetical protein